MQQLVDLHSWDVEQLLRLTYDQCEATGYNIETFTIVIDVAGWTVAQASRDAYTFIKGKVGHRQVEFQLKCKFHSTLFDKMTYTPQVWWQ